MLGEDPRLTKALLLGTVLLTAGLAGCAGSDGGAGNGSSLQWSSYEDAKSAPGQTFQATNTDSPVELKLLEPSSTSVSTGETTITFLLYDSETDEPVTDAQFTHPNKDNPNCGPGHSFCAEMPAMGHGTSPEESPSHRDYGVYTGMTTISMNGEWKLNVNPEIGGGVLEFDITLSA